MLSFDEARALAQQEMDLANVELSLSGLEEFVINDEVTSEHPFGWVFYYNARGAIEGNDRYALAGNGPIIVNRRTSEVCHLLTARDTESQIAEYESKCDFGHLDN